MAPLCLIAMPQTTTHDRRTILEMFTDGTPNESYSQGRLQTRETENGTIELVAYGWAKLAEYNESRDAVTVFTGHKNASDSTALSRYVNSIRDLAAERRSVILSGETPKVADPNDGTRFIGNYVNFVPSMSPVERDAVRSVEKSIDLIF